MEREEAEGEGQRLKLKLVVVGRGGVGKSALTFQFTSNQFVDEWDPTIQDFYEKKCIVDQEPMIIEILDTAGSEDYSATRIQGTQEGDGFLIVYDVTDRTSFGEEVDYQYSYIMREKEEKIKRQRESDIDGDEGSDGGDKKALKKKAPKKEVAGKAPIVLVGNKCDVVEEGRGARQVSREEGQAVAKKLGCYAFLETSAKTRVNVDEAFRELARAVRKQQRGDGGGGGAGGASKDRCYLS